MTLQEACIAGDLNFIKKCSHLELKDTFRSKPLLLRDLLLAPDFEAFRWVVQHPEINLYLDFEKSRLLLVFARDFPETLKETPLERLQWIISESKQFVHVAARDSELLRLTAENGKLEIVKWLLEDYDSAATSAAKKHNYILPQDYRIDINAKNGAALRWSTAFRQEAVVNYLVLESTQIPEILQYSKELLNKATSELAVFFKAVILCLENGISIEKIREQPKILRVVGNEADAQLLKQFSALEISQLSEKQDAKKVCGIKL